MVKQREGYQFIILEPAKTWINEGKCAGCGKPKSEWTRSTRWKCCSVECTKKYTENYTCYGWPELRMKAIERDGFKCIKCGKHEREIIGINTNDRWTWDEMKEHYAAYPKTYYVEYIDEEHKQIILHVPSKYVVDHIIPIAIGGEEWDINNLQTLCIECNKSKTKNDAGIIARERTKEKFMSAGQAFLEDYE